MFTKVLFKTMIPLGLLIVVFLAAQAASMTDLVAPAEVEAGTALSLVGSDWIERHPVSPKTNYYAGSDFIERRPSNYYTGSDYIERNSLAFSVKSAPSLAGSDWIERHPVVVVARDNFVGSDWIERHPAVVEVNDYFAGSDFIERRPSNYYTGSDYIERHP